MRTTMWLALLLLPGCYVLSSGYYQAELLSQRKRIERVERKGWLTESQLASLEVVADAKDFGKQIGLSATRNYETIALRWKRGIWVTTGCDPVAFEPVRRWFPIVGSVAYLGYFREKAALRRAWAHVRRGNDAHVRPAGAYSTLGWFRDPILPSMLDWSEYDLADTVLHELAHATLWVRGSVAFNESFASFVGEEAGYRYLANKYGDGSEEVAAARRREADRRQWRGLLKQVYDDLDAVYADDVVGDPWKLEAKAAVFASLPDRVRGASFHDPDRYVAAAERGPWNNARLIEYRTYNSRRPLFQAILDRNDGDLLAFIKDIREITRRERRDPFAALEAAAAAP